MQSTGQTAENGLNSNAPNLKRSIKALILASIYLGKTEVNANAQNANLDIK
jgi:hypothetical protein